MEKVEIEGQRFNPSTADPNLPLPPLSFLSFPSFFGRKESAGGSRNKFGLFPPLFFFSTFPFGNVENEQKSLLHGPRKRLSLPPSFPFFLLPFLFPKRWSFQKSPALITLSSPPPLPLFFSLSPLLIPSPSLRMRCRGARALSCPALPFPFLFFFPSEQTLAEKTPSARASFQRTKHRRRASTPSFSFSFLSFPPSLKEKEND